MKSRDDVITDKIISEISDIRAFIGEMSEEDYYEDRKTQKAVVILLSTLANCLKATQTSL